RGGAVRRLHRLPLQRSGSGSSHARHGGGVHPVRPVIGITPDLGQTSARPGRPSTAQYELKQAYADAVLAAGGLPIVLPYSEDASAPQEALDLCDGLV